MTTRSPSRVPERWRLGDHFVPKGRYLDPEFLQLEYERLFSRVWQMACRVEEIPARGDYVEYEIGKESILVINAGDAGLRAFFNACPHRGTRVARGRGKIEEFRCPFHGWRYALDGRCTYVHEAGDFGEDLSIDSVALAPCRVGSWGGWVFVSPDPDGPELLDWLDPLPTALAPFRPEQMRYGWRKGAIMPANWKTVIDAFIEGYHVGARHPQNLRRTRIDHGPATLEEMRHAPYQPSFALGSHSRFIYGVRPGPRSSAPAKMGDPDDVERQIAFTEYMAYGLRALATERDVRAARRLRDTEVPAGRTAFEVYQQLRREEAEADGVAWPEISSEEYQAGQGNWHVFPTMVVLIEPGCALGYRVRPDGDDPDRCRFEAWTLELYPEGEAPVVEPQFFDDWREHDGWGTLLPQDFENLPDVTGGMHSRAFRGLKLNRTSENGVFNHHRVADRFLFGDGAD